MTPTERAARAREQTMADAIRTITPVPELTPLANQARTLYLLTKLTQETRQ